MSLDSPKKSAAEVDPGPSPELAPATDDFDEVTRKGLKPAQRALGLKRRNNDAYRISEMPILRGGFRTNWQQRSKSWNLASDRLICHQSGWYGSVATTDLWQRPRNCFTNTKNCVEQL
ncbi:MAG: hypothetical protein OXE84_05410 [Rhodobacteraceae bacterium]|nr:hypothetical protein [Paracoccaceae bacterium]